MGSHHSSPTPSPIRWMLKCQVHPQVHPHLRTMNRWRGALDDSVELNLYCIAVAFFSQSTIVIFELEKKLIELQFSQSPPSN